MGIHFCKSKAYPSYIRIYLAMVCCLLLFLTACGKTLPEQHETTTPLILPEGYYISECYPAQDGSIYTYLTEKETRKVFISILSEDLPGIIRPEKLFRSVYGNAATKHPEGVKQFQEFLIFEQVQNQAVEWEMPIGGFMGNGIIYKEKN